MKKFLITALALTLVAGMVLSCGDDDETPMVPGEAKDAAAAASMAFDLTKMAMDMSTLALGMGGGAMAAKTGGYTAEPECPAVTIEAGTSTVEITVDYGTGCIEDGINKSGMLSISFAGSTLSAQISMNATDYTEGDESIDGEFTVTLEATDIGVDLELDVDVTFTNPQESCRVVLDETTVVDFNGTPFNGSDDNATVNGADTVTCDTGTLELDLYDVVIDASCQLNPISGEIDVYAYDSQTGESYFATITFHSKCDGKAEVELDGPNIHFEGTVDL
ncbi:MAG: hypothetical protein JSU92_05685 [Deltaproteobacteria bacterium]|nr:MAG: hypothetical protein JSU92_05685 [Deltaproteobacteria bacterium]